jgi:hypothetical protein
MELFNVGLAYSNIQNKYNAPTIVAGVRINASNLREVQQKKLEPKDKIISHVNSLRELQERFN